MKFLFVIIIAAIALAVAFGAYIKNDRAWRRAIRAYGDENKRLHGRVRELVANREDLKRKNAELREELGRMEERRYHYQDLTATLFETIDREHKEGIVIPVDGRKVYFERDGIRHIFVDNDYQGWYDPEHETVECVPHPSAAPTPSPEGRQGMTNYRWIKSMTVEEMADLLENFEEYAAKTCDPKYCDCGKPDGSCAPVPEGKTRSDLCRAATLKWLLDLHKEAGDTSSTAVAVPLPLEGKASEEEFL